MKKYREKELEKLQCLTEMLGHLKTVEVKTGHSGWRKVLPVATLRVDENQAKLVKKKTEVNSKIIATMSTSSYQMQTINKNFPGIISTPAGKIRKETKRNFWILGILFHRLI